MASKVQVKRKSMTKKNRTKSKGSMHRKKVVVRASGKGRNARRDSMGRYSRAEDEMQEGLMKLMDKAPDEQTRNEIRRLMENM